MSSPFSSISCEKHHDDGCMQPSPMKRPRSDSDSSNGIALSTTTTTMRKFGRHNGATTTAAAAATVVVKIVSATYGPAQGRMLLTGQLSNSNASRVPYTRDVTPFVKALLVAREIQASSSLDSPYETEEGSSHNNSYCSSSDLLALYDDHHEIRTDPPPPQDLVRIVAGQKRNLVHLMDGKSMNAIFGDPCPGTSKQLSVHYIIFDSMGDASIHGNRKKSSEVHRSTFAEHEPVILRRRVTYYQDESKLKDAVAAAANRLARATVSSNNTNHNNGENNNNNNNNNTHRDGHYSGHNDKDDNDHDRHHDDDSTLQKARRMGRAQAEFTEEHRSPPSLPSSVPTCLKTLQESTMMMVDESLQSVHDPSSLKKPSNKKWRLRSATSEIVLPIILPFLEVRERVQCQLVGKVWRFVVRQWGVAQIVDVNDPAFPNFNRQFLNGILKNSHHSLQSLFLGNFQALAKEDLHSALPYLRKLRSLDVSRCNQLDDSTLQLVSEHLSSTLEVFYLKGLRRVTDQGLTSVCTSCLNLRVLEISDVPITDESGISIGENLMKLRALYMKDNYLLTNRSIDVITEKCVELNQLALWGTTRLRHLSFERQSVGCGNLVLLNLWGCYGLADEAANSLRSMRNLRSLIVSECHRLTNAFLVSLARALGIFHVPLLASSLLRQQHLLSKHCPQLNHLHLRYCKKLTDDGIDAVANAMQNLYSLDLSFCTRVSSSCLLRLLEQRQDTLTELRLQNCTQLDIAQDRRQLDFPGDRGDGREGLAILNLLRTQDPNNHIGILDLRCCGGQLDLATPYPDNDRFVEGMRLLRFEQQIPGFFVRPVHWNPIAQQRLLDQLLSDSANSK